ncbi:alpha/beta hydrolase [Dactylosporangium sp. AC04546]|uniref:alpha/beta fold hydrolase n=1 Tax=Dactylosporangium sp. AC04546 TaxID=2862460 RepID=UPI001EE14D52|nr:alpha/beta hydrolase [Dactylosporangium sp. AC04546]WVK88007.1 alpha/beta hydrolase [Dactylosporangium sp. AC04546]
MRIELRRDGTGTPAVVFLPGAGLIGLEYLNVHERVAELTTSVLYDRGGTGWSDPVPLPRSAEAVARELRTALEPVPGPYVLAGHSLGAFYARRFAQLFPADVAGLVLIDPGHEDILDFLPARLAELNEQLKPDLDNLPELTPEQLGAAREALHQLYQAWPGPIREPLVELRLTNWRTGVEESRNMESELYAELRGGGPLPDVPLIVLTAMGHNPYWAKHLDADLLHEAHEGLRVMHAALAATVPSGEQRLVEGAAHQYLHVEQPDAVVAAVRDVVARFRVGQRGDVASTLR